MLNTEVFKTVALYLFENNEKITYYSFLESVKTKQNKVLVESIQNGFVALFEDNATSLNKKEVHDAFSGYVTLANALTNLTAKFQGGNGAAETKKMSDIKNKVPGSGKLQVKTYGGGEAGKMNPVTDYQIVAGDPDDSDVEKAKSILASSVIPLITMMATNAAKASTYLEPAKDFIVELMTDELPSMVDRFQFNSENPSSFFNYFKGFGVKNAYKRLVSKGSGVGMVSKVWGPDRDYNKGDVVNHNQANYKAIEDISATENKLPPPQASQLWSQFGKSTSQVMSTDADMGGTGQGEDDAKKTVGEVLTSEHGAPAETETNVDVKKLMAMLPDSPDKKALMMLYGVGAPRLTDVEIAEKLSKDTGKEISRTTVHNMVKRALDQIRSKANIHA